MPCALIQECLVNRWQVHGTNHVAMRLNQRSLSRELLYQGASTLEIIERYPDDKYRRCCLVRGEQQGLVFHAHVALDIEAPNIRIVTMYVPSRLIS